MPRVRAEPTAGQGYPSDLTDAQWQVIMPHLPAELLRRQSRPDIRPTRTIGEAILSGGRRRIRLTWGVADQAVSSLTNFAVSIYVVRTLGAVQFRAFSLAYVTYGFALNVSRGLGTDPLMVRFSGTDRRTPGGGPSPAAPR